MRVVALDYGEKRIGVAVAQTEIGIALPATVLPNDVEAVVRWLKQEGAECVVVGMPTHLWGEKSVRAQQVEAFIEALQARLNISIETVDERLTTREAERRLIEGDMRRARRKEVQDAVAAALILETYLAQFRQKYT